MERLTYTVSEVAQALGISQSKAYMLVAEGAIPVVPLPGRRKLVARATLDRLLGAAAAADDPSPTSTNHRPHPTTNPQPLTPNPQPLTPNHDTDQDHRPSPTTTNDHPTSPHQTVAPRVRGSDPARRAAAR